MKNEIGLWNFVAQRLRLDRPVMLLVVAQSSGSSPGRAGYKMAIGADGELCGSIGGGVMEVKLVERAKLKSKKAKGKNGSEVCEQVHRKGVSNPSGMICSGQQTILFKELTSDDMAVVESITSDLRDNRQSFLTISQERFEVEPSGTNAQNIDFNFEKRSDRDFVYQEKLGPKNNLYIIGGGHCALALSEMVSKMDFRISIFDDRPELNTIKKNDFADEITIIDSYERIGELIPVSQHIYVVVMTIGYASDEAVIRGLFDRDFKYFGVLGSKAKMATLMKTLRNEGYDAGRLERIRTPIGLPINSHTPEEIAVSIAAEIIAVKNAD